METTAQLKRPAAERNALISSYVDVARRISLRISRRCPEWVAREDLVSAGMLGLIEAADRYDSSRKEPFLPFAEKRIRGAVLDELRRGDILPRRARQMARKVGAAIQTIEKQTGSAPSDEAVATALGVSVVEYRTNLEHLVHVTVGVLDESEDSAAMCMGGSSPESAAARGEALGKVRAALPKLEKRDLLVLSLYYVEELTYAELAQVIGVTTARVCQLHARAITRLRAEIEAQESRKAA
jgi:RNA polymerase sigma factor for flagellar operon FliA